MKASRKKAILKKRGRPATGNAPSRTFRLTNEFMATLDAWAIKQIDSPSRSEAIRRLVEMGLTVKSKGRQSNEGQRLRAREMAGHAIDSMADASAHADDQASRKRRLLKGPEEFASRIDRPKAKK